ncbi:phosphonate C-P lyase system protein PhnH [uncultured Roseobacter sp.]|uniref:phosphonate C-P lyase system protein PhnH n=1 Tax=uncultured Roseobacter sp. TaxID=114847 RepID=UPI00263799BD|nr:phosphonate C-P lyase system protein PhnH [uncultured Roseobacter sp.]
MQTLTLEGGFAQPAEDAARAFRAIMESVARPGTIRRLQGAQPPRPRSQAAGAAILTLCDGDTPVFLAGVVDCQAVRDWIAFHTGAPFCTAAEATFAAGSWNDLQPLSAYPVGTPEYPNRSATLIADLPRLAPVGVTLTGPGIKTTSHLSRPEAACFQTNHGLLPVGLDFLFTCDDLIAAVPRSAEVC